MRPIDTVETKTRREKMVEIAKVLLSFAAGSWFGMFIMALANAVKNWDE